MSTPIKNFLFSSKVSSPIKLNNVLSPLKFTKNAVVNSLSPKNYKHETASKRLLFSKPTPTKTERSLTDIEKLVSPRKTFTFTVTDYSTENNTSNIRNDLLINTPNKLDLLKNGVSKNKSLNVLGRGTFGTVVKGIYQEKIVAVKVKKFIDGKNTTRETNCLTLRHENIIHIIDVILRKSENYCLVIMEYHEDSKHLQLLLDDLKNDINILQITKDISKGIHYLHENNILHLDIKPSNILVCDGICKLCDFGNSVRICKINTDYKFQGTVPYTDPEILLGKLPTFKSDIYSLGVVMWQLKSRTFPYEDCRCNEIIIYKVVKYGLRPEMEKSVTQDYFEKLYTSCWKSNPNERPNIREVCKLLEEL